MKKLSLTQNLILGIFLISMGVWGLMDRSGEGWAFLFGLLVGAGVGSLFYAGNKYFSNK